MNAINDTITAANGVKAIKTSHFEFHSFKLMSHSSSAKPYNYSQILDMARIHHNHNMKTMQQYVVVANVSLKRMSMSTHYCTVYQIQKQPPY